MQHKAAASRWRAAREAGSTELKCFRDISGGAARATSERHCSAELRKAGCGNSCSRISTMLLSKM